VKTQTVTFPNNAATLSSDAKGTLDQVAGNLVGQQSGYMLELEGYTDVEDPNNTTSD